MHSIDTRVTFAENHDVVRPESYDEESFLHPLGLLLHSLSPLRGVLREVDAQHEDRPLTFRSCCHRSGGAHCQYDHQLECLRLGWVQDDYGSLVRTY